MTKSLVVSTDLADSTAAGAFLGSQIAARFTASPVDAVIVFASARYDCPRLLAALTEACSPGTLVGCSSSGEFTNVVQGEGLACAVALHSPTMRFSVGIGHGIKQSRAAAAQSLVSSFHGLHTHEYPHHAALVLADALAGHLDELVENLTVLTAGTYQLFGGGAGDDGQFRHTQVFCGTEVATDAIVALEILSQTPLGIGVGHGWQPASPLMRVTEVDGLRLISLDAAPAVEAFEEHAARTGQTFDQNDPLPFFLHNVLGIHTDSGYKLRVPLAVAPDGSIACAAEVPAGVTVAVMSVAPEATTQAVATATHAALDHLEGQRPEVALFFDCVATRLRMGRDFGFALGAVEQALGASAYVGCNTHGQVARAEGQFSGFHNCTAVVCIIPG